MNQGWYLRRDKVGAARAIECELQIVLARSQLGVFIHIYCRPMRSWLCLALFSGLRLLIFAFVSMDFIALFS